MFSVQRLPVHASPLLVEIRPMASGSSVVRLRICDRLC